MNIKKTIDIRKILLIVNIIFSLSFIIFPVYSLFKYAFSYNNKFVGFNNFYKYIMNEKLLQAVKNSFNIAIIVSCLSLILVFLYVYGIKRTHIKFKRVFKWMPIVLFSIPTLIHGISLICVFGKKGLIAQIFSVNINIYGKLGIIICNVLYVFPVIYSLLYVGFDMCDYRLYEVADVMGTKNLRKFFTITLPNMKFTLINAFFSAFILVFTDFGAVKVIGGNYSVVSMDIYQQVIGQQNFSIGAVSGIILMLPSIIFLLIEYFISYNNNNVINNCKFKIKKNYLRDIIFQIYSIFIFCIVIFEVIIVIIMSLVKNWPYDMKFTFQWYKVKCYGISSLEIYYNTLIVALITALFGSILAFSSAYLVERYKKWCIIRKIQYLLNKLPLTLPGLSLGLSYILFFNNSGNPYHFIYGTFIILILSNIIHFFSVPFLNVISVLKKINKDYESVSEILGVPWYVNLIKVILPLSITAIIETFLYYFLNAMITVSAVIFLYSSTTRVASVEIVNKSDIGNLQSACAIGIMIIITNLIFKICVEKVLKNKGD